MGEARDEWEAAYRAYQIGLMRRAETDDPELPKAIVVVGGQAPSWASRNRWRIGSFVAGTLTMLVYSPIYTAVAYVGGCALGCLVGLTIDSWIRRRWS